jgi:hypothetical protein
MQKLVARLLAQLSPSTHQQNASSDKLDKIIDGLRRRQIELGQRLSTQTGGAEKRRLKIALQVAHLQEKKALALRKNLPQP